MRDFAATFISKQALTLNLWFEPAEMTGFTHLEVWRSTLTAAGPYEELTATTAMVAELVCSSFHGNLVGKTLSFLLNETTIDVTFTGVDPLTPADAAAQITAAGGGVLVGAVSSLGELCIRSVNVGSSVRLELVDGSAVPFVGMADGISNTIAYGRDARQALSSSQKYSFTDVWYRKGCHYKTRLRSATTGAVSPFSDAIASDTTCVVDPSSLIRGWLRLADMQGRPIVGRTILLSTVDTARNVLVNGVLVDGDDQHVTTDTEGYASVILLRGVPVVMAIANTAIVRNILPPTDLAVDSFHLLDPLVSKDDAFAVQHTPLVLAERILP